MTTKTLDQHIEITPGIAGGKPRVAGHPIAVEDIVILHERAGKAADEIAAEYNLTLVDVHVALAYYYDHKAEIDRSIGEGNGSIEAPREPTPQQLMSRFLLGVGSVLEFFPSPARFESWRLGHDVSINEWPTAVRGELADLQEDVPKHGDPV
jgi:uncharacterized protein (DUF433 family)